MTPRQQAEAALLAEIEAKRLKKAKPENSTESQPPVGKTPQSSNI